MKDLEIKSALIIGMSGGLAQITTNLIEKKYPHIKLTGVDSRPIADKGFYTNADFIQMKYTRGNFEKLFREKKFDLVIHLARMSHTNANPKVSLEQRLDLNLMGTRRILDLALKFKVKKFIILSTYHVYGALSDNPVFIEEDAALKASIKYPELRDVVDMDQMATNWMWQHQDQIETLVLRPCTIVGPKINNTMTKYLTTDYVPICVDFNPMFQLIHEYDMANFLVESISSVPSGVYNIAPKDVVSIKQAKAILESPTMPVPSLFLDMTAKFLQFWHFPKYIIDYIKFACIIDNSKIMKYFPEDFFSYSTKDTLKSLQSDKD